MADASYWSDANTATETDTCELFSATQKDHAQRAALRDAPPPRGRKPKNVKARERMQRKLRTKRGRTRYRQRGASVEPVFGQMKNCRGARQFSMRALAHLSPHLSHPSITRTPAISQQAPKDNSLTSVISMAAYSENPARGKTNATART